MYAIFQGEYRQRRSLDSHSVSKFLHRNGRSYFSELAGVLFCCADRDHDDETAAFCFRSAIYQGLLP